MAQHRYLPIIFRKIKVKLLLTLAGWVILVGSIVFSSIYGYHAAAQRSEWSTVPGSVIDSSVKKEYEHSGSSGELYPVMKVSVEYIYSVNGVKYTGSQKFDGQGSYAPGSNIKVYYNPDRHEESVIKITNDIGIPLTLLIVGLFFIGIFLVALPKIKKS